MLGTVWPSLSLMGFEGKPDDITEN